MIKIWFGKLNLKFTGEYIALKRAKTVILSQAPSQGLKLPLGVKGDY